MSKGIESGTIINEVITETTSKIPPFATSNPNKIAEIADTLGILPEELPILNPHIDEVQSRDPDYVIRKKAIAAFEATKGTPVVVEDTSLKLPIVESKFPSTQVTFWAESAHDRADIAEEVNRKGDPRALAQTRLAVYDGKNVQVRTGSTTGTVPIKPRGAFGFGFDDIFIPDGQDKKNENRLQWLSDRFTPILQSIGFAQKEKTFAEMTLAEKQEYSMRQKALEKLKENPFEIGIWVYALQEALQMELDAIDKEYFKGPEMEKARHYAYKLRVLGDQEPNEDLTVDMEKLPPFHEVQLHEDITQYTLDPNSPDLGLLLTKYETRTMPDGSETRLLKNYDGRPTFLQHGEKSIKRALAARAYEYSIHHNDERYAELREMIDGKRTAERTNKRSLAIEMVLGMLKINPGTEILSEENIESGDVFSVPGFTSLAYPRQFSEESLSRTRASHNHIINRNGIPTSVFSLGGMPPVTGSRDVNVTAAESFMRTYISHNSLFVDFERRRKMFKECKEQVYSNHPEQEHEDIRDLVLAQIGVCVSGKDVAEINQQTNDLMDDGCRSMRIYTTNPGVEVIDSAEEICKLAFERGFHEKKLPFHLCVGPVVNVEQAEKLQELSEQYGVALTLLAGHGGGENCTSLEGGAAANAIEIMYKMSLDKRFNNVSLGFEGGLGTWFGPWMGIIDQISKNGDIVRGCVETQGGLNVLHKSGAPVQIYSGTAGPTTQITENTLFPELAHRTNPAGQLKNNEGRPNFMKASRWAQSITHHFNWYRSVYGRVLADQQAGSIDDMMEHIEKNGFKHRIATADAVNMAKEHRSV